MNHKTTAILNTTIPPVPSQSVHRYLRGLMAIAVGWLSLVAIAPPARAQVGTGRTFPTLPYYNSISTFDLGDFRNALKGFQGSARLGLRFGNDRWADSICYFTMQGESLYRLGEMSLALEQYNFALRTFLLNRDWLRRVEFPAAIGPSQSLIRQSIAWGERKTVMGHFPRKMQVLFGDPNAQSKLQTGGVYAPPELRSIDVVEIVRCTALALRRRAELLGPVGPTDPMASQLLVAMEGRIGRNNHWSQAWIEVQRGLALIGMEKDGEGSDALTRSLLIAGQYDHPLTATALFELGRIAERQENYGLASQNYLQASLAAAQYEQASLVEESLHRLSVVHMLSGGRGVPAGVEPAAAWAKRNRYGQLYSSLMVDLAENLAVSGEPKAAQAAVVQAQKAIGRRRRVSVQVAARLSMQEAMINYQKGKAEAAREALATAVGLQRTCSPWLFQLSIVNALYESNSDELSDREATLLYESLLREPTSGDWMTQTLETMAALSASKEASFQHWFEVTMERGEEGRAIEIAELHRRHRFFAQLPLAGRLMALRWMLEAPEELLADDVRQRRVDLKNRYPELNELSQQIAGIRKQLRAADLGDDDPDVYKSQLEIAKQLHSASAAYEHRLGEIALRREESPYSFPPLMTLEQIQKRLKKNQLVVAFFTTDRTGYAMMISTTDHAVWPLPSLSRARKGVSALLRDMGMTGDANSLSFAQLENPKWKKTSAALVDELIDKPQHGFWKKFDEILVVPDGFLWYLPFEALMVTTADGEEVPLIAASRVRYAPTIALALPDGRKQRRDPRSAVVLGQLFPRDGIELSREQLTEMQEVVKGLEALPERVAAPSGIMRSTWDRLVVFDDLKNTKKGPLEWAPAGFDQDRPQTGLNRWMSLPWGGPLEVYLPGFHTAAENGLRKAATGDDIFFALTGLMSSGTQTILLSRWRTGGQTSYDLVREHLQEMPSSSASEAWQRAVQILRDSEINPSWEPRVNAPAKNEQLITADHPFFWSGYILCDRGSQEEETTEPPQEPAEMRQPDPEPSADIGPATK